MKMDKLYNFDEYITRDDNTKPDFCVYLLIETSKDSAIILRRCFRKFKLNEDKIGLRTYLSDVIESFETKQSAILNHSIINSEPLYMLKDIEHQKIWMVKREYFSKDEILSYLVEVTV